MFYGGPAGASIGSGIGSLASGRDLDDALKNAALAYGIGSLGQQQDLQKHQQVQLVFLSFYQEE